MSARWSGRRVRAICLLALACGLPASLCAAEPGPEHLRVGARAEVAGELKNDVFGIEKLELLQPSKYSEFKALLKSIDREAGLLVVGPFTVEIVDKTKFSDAEDAEAQPTREDLEVGVRLKIEGELTAPGHLRARKIEIDRKKKKDSLELEGVIESFERLSETDAVLVIMGIRCVINDKTQLPPGSLPPWVRRPDDDDSRPAQQLVLWDRLTIGGELQVDFGLEDDYDLDRGDNKDIFEADTSMSLEGLFDLRDGNYLFAKMRSAKAYVIFDEKRDKHLVEQTQLEEANLYLKEVAGSPFSVLIGRQDFDDKREWLYDENLDGARAYWRSSGFEVEYSWSTYIADAPRGRSDIWNQILAARYFYLPRSWFEVYMIDIQDHSRADNSPFYVGTRLLSREKALQYWLDYAYLDGVEGTQKLEAHGIDVGGAYQFRRTPLRPYVFASYAFATGDDHADGRTDRNFRQTGYNDNNDKVFGVASYRYYGELLEPELSNLHIASAGVGIEPAQWISVDVVYHKYTQHHASTVLRNTNLRASPAGFSRDVGEEIDLVLGLNKLLKRFDVELDLGYFTPGNAFQGNEHPALWVALQLELNF
ncbi:MAG: alginate export family protein [Planctomycetota bacterium]